MNLFIDTNVYLSFYHLTNDDLEELRKLAAVVNEKKIRLFVTVQVQQEFWRNRENKLKESLKDLRNLKLSLQYPNICKEYPAYEEMRAHQKQFSALHSSMMAAIISDIDARSLRADEVIEQLFGIANVINHDEQILANARDRTDLGNPPGKKGSLGDAVNWECLLSRTPQKEDLHFVSIDGDFASPLDDEKFNQFLLEEFSSRKHASLLFYQSLAGFFAKHFPTIKLASSVETELAIEDLVNSWNFAATHVAIGKLRNLADLTPDQVRRIARAATENSQIRRISGDADVRSLLEYLLAHQANAIEPDVFATLRRIVDEQQTLDS
jgi:hypothetical protein